MIIQKKLTRVEKRVQELHSVLKVCTVTCVRDKGFFRDPVDE